MAALTLFAASCTKESTAPNTDQQNTAVKHSGFGSMEQYNKNYRKVTKDWNCVGTGGNCHPDDIVITGKQQAQLDAAISLGAIAVSQLFATEATAKIYIPDWNNQWFAEPKAAILSGRYTFIKAGKSTYLLGRAGEVSTEKFDYAVPYIVQ